MVQKNIKESENKIKEQHEIKEFNPYDLNSNIFDLYPKDENKFKFLSKFLLKNIFEESTRGWNFDNNIYILNISKLTENLKKVKISNKLNIVLGYFYRDYNNSKIYLEKDITKFWIGDEINSKTSVLINK